MSRKHSRNRSNSATPNRIAAEHVVQKDISQKVSLENGLNQNAKLVPNEVDKSKTQPIIYFEVITSTLMTIFLIFISYQSNQISSKGNYLIDKGNEISSIQIELEKQQADLTKAQNALVASQAELAESQRRAGSASDLSSILDRVEEAVAKADDARTEKIREANIKIKLAGHAKPFIAKELNEARGAKKMLRLDPQQLPSRLNKRIISYCNSLSSYRVLNASSMLEGPYSPERMMLLTYLITIPVDMFDIFKEAKFERCLFEKSTFVDDSFAGADLSGSTFRKSTFANCDFSGSNLEGCIFDDSDFFMCNFKNARLPDANNFSGRSTKELNPEGATVADSNWLEKLIVHPESRIKKTDYELKLNIDRTNANMSQHEAHIDGEDGHALVSEILILRAGWKIVKTLPPFKPK